MKTILFALLAALPAFAETKARNAQIRGAPINVCDRIGPVCPSGGDDTAAVQAALDQTAAINGTLLVPPGTYNISSTLTVTGNASAGTGLSVKILGSSQGFKLSTPKGTVFAWTGADAPGTVLMKVNGVGRFSMSDIDLYGAGTVETIFYATQNTPTTFSGYGWRFENVNFELVRANGRVFSIPDTSSDMARFTFTGCTFTGTTQNGSGALAASGVRAFYSNNQNSLNHTFQGTGFQLADYGIYLDGGSFTCSVCEFSRNAVADINFVVNSPSSVIKSWTEQSRQFIIGTNSANTAPVTIIDSKIASYPWAYWKLFESTRAQPTNDATQWRAISWDRNGSLNLLGSNLLDPNSGNVTGVTAPTTSSTPTVAIPNAKTSPLDVNITGSLSSLGATSTNQFFWFGSAQAAPRSPMRKRYVNNGNQGASISVDILSGSVQEFNLGANATVTLDTTHADPGDVLTMIFKEGGGGGFTTGFVNVNLLNGTMTPVLVANARSSLTVQFNGTTWDEIARSGDVAPPASTFANLGAATSGTLLYCSDCTIANPCAGGGTGALAKRLNGVWVCN